MSEHVLGAPDDFHLHVRDGQALKDVLVFSARQFRRAIIMPNLPTPVVTTADALSYRSRIMDTLHAASQENKQEGALIASFQPLMTLYLTDTTTPEEITKAKQSGAVFGVKLYPANVTTNSASGVTDIKKVYPTLHRMAECGIPLLVHGEFSGPDIDIFDRESEYITRVLKPLLAAIPSLRVVMEHISTREAVDFVLSGPPNLAATITPQHLLFNRNALFNAGLRPHFYCMPILKGEEHRQAVLRAATSGNAKFFAGTDSAPHKQGKKECACGSAGCFSAPAALEMYAQAFDSVGALNHLDAFVSANGAAFYGLPRNPSKITLRKQPWTVPSSFQFDGEAIVPLMAGEKLDWKLEPLASEFAPNQSGKPSRL